MTWLTKILQRANISSDVVMAIVLAAILGAMIIPLPSWLLDFGLAINLAASISLLVAALYASDPLKVASFPTLLLVTTLFRLSLNVSSTRLALAEGHAGKVIEAFGEFVVAGDYVVGAVVFLILTLVQFLVVAKGAERVAEVSARFTLDAMPGKQMAIDADLRSGAIDQAQAKMRRRALERESQMFGSMDGAMKFVKGDVIAGLVIVAVNFFGGTLIGVMQQQLAFSEAASRYALIAIGDGLVSQIPSLCIALGAGLVVTRVSGEADESSIGDEIGRQFFGQWRALFVVSGLSLAMALIPGMPKLAFLFVSAGALAGGVFLKRRGETEKAEKEKKEAEAAAPKPGTGANQLSVGVVPLTLELSPALTAQAASDGIAELSRKLDDVREKLFAEMGVRSPFVLVRGNVPQLSGTSYRLLIDELPRGTGQVEPQALFAMAPPDDLQLVNVQGEARKEPSTGKTISKIAPEARATVESAQIQVLTGIELMTHHLGSILRRNIGRLLGIEEVQVLVKEFELRSPALVKEALGKVPLPLLTEVLRRLVEEQVSVRNIRLILEALADPTTEGDSQALAERCRRSLQHYFSHRYAPTGPLYAHLVDPSVEELLRQNGEAGSLEPEKIERIVEGVRRLTTDGKAVLLASPDVRKKLRRLVEVPLPDVAVLSYGELDAELPIRPIGRLIIQ